MHCARAAPRRTTGTSILVVSYFKLLDDVCGCKSITCINNKFNINVRGALRTTM